MGKLRALGMRIRGLMGARRGEAEIDAELESHVAMDMDDGVRAGLSHAEARRQALIRLGGAEQTRQALRERRGLPWLESLGQDVRYAARQLVKAPGFALAAILTLALGIGANTAMFSLLDQVVLRLLPVSHPEQLVIVRETGNHFGNSYGPNTISWPMFEDLRDNNRVFSGTFCRFPFTVELSLFRSVSQTISDRWWD